MSGNHRHHFREHPRGVGEAEWEHGKLNMLLADLELQETSMGLQDGHMKVCILQVQSNHPITQMQGRQNLAQVEHFEFAVS